MALTTEQKALAAHRRERAQATLDDAVHELERGNYRLTVNRAYYSVYYVMRAFLAMIDADSSKHSGALALFNRHFIKTGVVSDVSAKIIQTLMDLRHEGDYQDFAEISSEEARGAVQSARTIVESLSKTLASMM